MEPNGQGSHRVPPLARSVIEFLDAPPESRATAPVVSTRGTYTEASCRGVETPRILPAPCCGAPDCTPVRAPPLGHLRYKGAWPLLWRDRAAVAAELLPLRGHQDCLLAGSGRPRHIVQNNLWACSQSAFRPMPSPHTWNRSPLFKLRVTTVPRASPCRASSRL